MRWSNEVDPVGLIEMGCPEDEYDPEIQDLIRWREPVTPDRVLEVFLRWFGAETGTMLRTEAMRIADGINEARVQHLPDAR